MPVTTDHIERIYFQFRKAQSDHFSRGFRMPKDFEKHFNTIFKDQNKRALTKITGWFLTKWQNIDPYLYFKAGFELYDKRFSYMKFFKEKILLLYKTRDKNRKRGVKITKQGLIKSAIFVKKWLERNGQSTLEDYINNREGNQRIAVDHYIKDKIDASFFIFLMQKGMILTDTERSVIPYIHTNYRKILFELKEIPDFLKKMEGKI